MLEPLIVEVIREAQRGTHEHMAFRALAHQAQILLQQPAERMERARAVRRKLDPVGAADRRTKGKAERRQPREDQIIELFGRRARGLPPPGRASSRRHVAPGGTRV